MLFSSRLLPSDIEKGQYGDTPERQAELSFQHARRLVEMAGGGPENICQIRAFVTEPGIRPAIDEQVHSMFPNEQRRPFVEVLHYPSAGPLQAMIEVIASGLPDASGASVPAAVHEVFHEVSRSASGGPAPAGVRIGDVIFLSRVAGRDPATGGFSGGLGAQFRRALESTDSLLRRSGAGMENVARVTVFDGSPGELGVLDNVWEGLYPDHDDRPARKVVKAGLQAGSLVELSVLAIAGSRRRTPAVL
jgi:enamine deaminase RidA (YjgF/YER057c/UK114 family)